MKKTTPPRRRVVRRFKPLPPTHTKPLPLAGFRDDNIGTEHRGVSMPDELSERLVIEINRDPFSVFLRVCKNEKAPVGPST